MSSSDQIRQDLDKHFPGHDYTLEEFFSEFEDYAGHRSAELRLLRKTFSSLDAVISPTKYIELLS